MAFLRTSRTEAWFMGKGIIKVRKLEARIKMPRVDSSIYYILALFTLY